MNARRAQSSKLVAHMSAWPAAAKQPLNAPDEQQYTRSTEDMTPAASSTWHIPAETAPRIPPAFHHQREDVRIRSLARSAVRSGALQQDAEERIVGRRGGRWKQRPHVQTLPGRAGRVFPRRRGLRQSRPGFTMQRQPLRHGRHPENDFTRRAQRLSAATADNTCFTSTELSAPTP
jgi:hypothetical protein